MEQDPTQPVSEAVAPDAVEAAEAGTEENAPTVVDGSKLIRIASMTRAMLEEARSAPLDEAGRRRISEIYERSLDELSEVVSEDLRAELEEMFVPWNEDATPSQAELRVAQAQLVGWLEGLFNGIQAALFSQQLATRAQLEQMRSRRALGNATAEDEGHGVYL